MTGDLSLTALAIYKALRDGGWHPSEYDSNPACLDRWYAQIAQRAAEAVVQQGAPSEPTLLVEDPPDRQPYSSGWTPSEPTP